MGFMGYDFEVPDIEVPDIEYSDIEVPATTLSPSDIEVPATKLSPSDIGAIHKLLNTILCKFITPPLSVMPC